MAGDASLNDYFESIIDEVSKVTKLLFTETSLLSTAGSGINEFSLNLSLKLEDTSA
jgi:hypothetical protein